MVPASRPAGRMSSRSAPIPVLPLAGSGGYRLAGGHKLPLTPMPAAGGGATLQAASSLDRARGL